MGRPRDEAGLISRAKRGETSAFEELVRVHEGVAFRIAYLITGSAADAEEAAQDGFVKAYAALGRFRQGRPFRPWLLTIVANEARNRRRSTGRRTALTLRAAEEIRPGDAAPSPEAVVVARDRHRELVAALNRLSEEHRLVLACRYFLDLNEAECAAALGVRAGTVKSRTSRALERLRQEVPTDA